MIPGKSVRTTSRMYPILSSHNNLSFIHLILWEPLELLYRSHEFLEPCRRSTAEPTSNLTNDATSAPATLFTRFTSNFGTKFCIGPCFCCFPFRLLVLSPQCSGPPPPRFVSRWTARPEVQSEVDLRGLGCAAPTPASSFCMYDIIKIII